LHALHRLSRSGDLRSAEQAAERLKGATIALNSKVPLRRDALEQLPDLKLIAISGTGTDCVDKN
jgi:glycerate dehydrogenase